MDQKLGKDSVGQFSSDPGSEAGAAEVEDLLPKSLHIVRFLSLYLLIDSYRQCEVSRSENRLSIYSDNELSSPHPSPSR